MDEFPAVKAWEERMAARSGVEKGRHVPTPHTIKDVLKDPKLVEQMMKKGGSWVQEGMKDDAKKQERTT